MSHTIKSRFENSKAMKTWSSIVSNQKSNFVGILTIVVYLTVVVITTPALGPLDAISAAFQLNSIVIIGMGIGIGLQIYLTEKSKLLGCKLDIKKKTLGGNTGSTAATSFFSFFFTCSFRLLRMVALRIVITSKCFWNRCLSCINRI